jgi:hypothetical protein
VDIFPKMSQNAIEIEIRRIKKQVTNRKNLNNERVLEK